VRPPARRATCSSTARRIGGFYPGPLTYQFVNALSGKPGSLDVTFGAAGQIHLQWATLVLDDQSVAAPGR
jgi:hypothetical protein